MTETLVDRYRALMPLEPIRELLILSADVEDLSWQSECLSSVMSDLYPDDAQLILVHAYIGWTRASDEKFELASVLLLKLLNQDKWAGAAGVMLNRISVSSSGERDIRSIERSIEAEPTWVENYSQLAEALQRAGDVEGSNRALEVAISNCLDRAEMERADPALIAWMDMFTGQYSDPAVLARRRI